MKLLKTLKINLTPPLEVNPQVTLEQAKRPKAALKYIFIPGFIVWLATGVYIVDPAERGVVLRFGAFQTSATQGPHWHIPYPT